MGKFSGKKCRLLSMMVLTGFFFFVEIIVGYVTNSMALVADSFHMLGDIAALVISFLSVKVSLIVIWFMNSAADVCYCIIQGEPTTMPKYAPSDFWSIIKDLFKIDPE